MNPQNSSGGGYDVDDTNLLNNQLTDLIALE
jgi:hypothetical protein